MTGTKPTNLCILVRSFRGAQLFLISYRQSPGTFRWHRERTAALKMPHSEALFVARAASREYGAECAVEDANGVLTAPAMVAQKSQQQQAKHGATPRPDTISVPVIGPKSGNKYNVDLYFAERSTTPHGYEATNAETTNESGYYRSGMLQFEGQTLVDYDGTFALPKIVAMALRSQGFIVPEDME